MRKLVNVLVADALGLTIFPFLQAILIPTGNVTNDYVPLGHVIIISYLFALLGFNLLMLTEKE